MNNNSGDKSILISLIGKARNKKGQKGYDKSNYYFKETGEHIETSLFSSALYKVLQKLDYKIDKWLVFGTAQSMWSELLYAVDEEYHENLTETYNKIYDGENKSASEELIKEWESELQKYIPGIRLIMVNALDYEIYINHMIKEIPNERRCVILDITHGLRHMPVIIAFSLMLVRYLKNISDIALYYAANELKEEDKGNNLDSAAPVLKIDLINSLVAYTENLAVFNNSGYFSGLLGNMGIQDTDKTYFSLEMNRQPKSQLKEIVEKLDCVAQKGNYESYIAKHIKDEIEPLITITLDRRMIERAKFFFNKKQYLKALILLYEGIILAIGRKYNIGTSLDYRDRENIRSYINKNKGIVFENEMQKKIYYDLEYTRNAAAHGSISRGSQNYLEIVSEFEELFKQGIDLYENLVKS